MTDTGVTLTGIGEFELPYGRRVRLVDARYESGLRMLRLIWREGKRITQVEIGAEDAAALRDALAAWAQSSAGTAD